MNQHTKQMKMKAEVLPAGRVETTVMRVVWTLGTRDWTDWRVEDREEMSTLERGAERAPVMVVEPWAVWKAPVMLRRPETTVGTTLTDPSP